MPARQFLNSLRELVRPYYLKWLYFRLAAENCPSYFRECWDYPLFPIGPELRKLRPQPGTAPDFVFLPMVDWHARIQRSQQLASTLGSLGHQCVYLSPHLGREFRETFLTSPRRVVGSIAPGVLELHIHLPREPVFHHRRLCESEDHDVERSILALLEALGSRNVVLVVSLPLWTGVARRLREKLSCPIVYDCHDLLEGFDNMDAGIIGEESELMRIADVIAFSADGLMREHAARAREILDKSVVIRNAVDTAAFQMTDRVETGVKTVGYIGSLNSWLDVESIRTAANRRPEWRFILIGRKESATVDRLMQCPNVSFEGERPYRELPVWLAKFDVAMIPFLLQPLTMSTNPIKLYEYFACGLPVVSSRLPEVERYSELVYLASTPDEFADQLEHALAEDTNALRKRRRLVAESESWISRCKQLLHAVARPSRM